MLTACLRRCEQQDRPIKMSTFTSRVSEVTVEMDGLHVTTVTALEAYEYAENDTVDEARVGDFHMSRFTAMEWKELSGLIEKAIEEVTK